MSNAIIPDARQTECLKIEVVLSFKKKVFFYSSFGHKIHVNLPWLFFLFGPSVPLFPVLMKCVNAHSGEGLKEVSSLFFVCAYDHPKLNYTFFGDQRRGLCLFVTHRQSISSKFTGRNYINFLPFSHQVSKETFERRTMVFLIYNIHMTRQF